MFMYSMPKSFVRGESQSLLNVQKISNSLKIKFPALRSTGIFNSAILVFATIITISSTVQSQDIHYSQFQNAPFTINPALTGIFKGDVRFMTNIRSQWEAVPVSYRTVTMAADMQFIDQYYKDGFFSGGITFNYDYAGDSRFNWTNLGLTGSYTKKLNPYVYASIGLQGSVNQSAFNVSDLSFDVQYNSDRGVYDPSAPISENFSNTSNTFMDFGAGFNLRFQGHDNNDMVDRLEKRSKLDVGIGLGHVFGPNMSFTQGTNLPLSMRVSPYFLGTVQVAENIDIVANGLAQFQNPYNEYLGMVAGKVHINRKLGSQFAIQLGLGYRFNEQFEFGDAYIPQLHVDYNNWSLGFSYDINVSDFEVATDGRGGPELALRYVIMKVKPLENFKACPIM